MQIDTDKWDKEDYLAFILLYLAESDGNLEAEELKYIADHLGKEHLDHIRKPATKCNDYQCLEIMQNLRPRFYPGEEGIDTLKMEMKALFLVDGRFSQFENQFVQLIAKQL